MRAGSNHIAPWLEPASMQIHIEKQQKNGARCYFFSIFTSLASEIFKFESPTIVVLAPLLIGYYMQIHFLACRANTVRDPPLTYEQALSHLQTACRHCRYEKIKNIIL